jgi:hypothetical protein
MQHSLTNRFRGAFLGAAIADLLATNVQHHQGRSSCRDLEYWGFQPVAAPSSAGLEAIAQTRALIATQTPLPSIQDSAQDLALLPLALFYHDDLNRLQSLIPDRLTPCLPMAIAIAQALVMPSAFLSFRHTVLQAMHRPDAALTGAIAGATVGLTGIPPSWRQRSGKAGYASGWNLTETELLQLADQLLAAWSGVYLPQQPQPIIPVTAASRFRGV